MLSRMAWLIALGVLAASFGAVCWWVSDPARDNANPWPWFDIPVIGFYGSILWLIGLAGLALYRLIF